MCFIYYSRLIQVSDHQELGETFCEYPYLAKTEWKDCQYIYSPSEKSNFSKETFSALPGLVWNLN